MTNKSNKIRAFTLNEMIVVLLITTIVVGMAFSVLNLVQRQMEGIRYNYGNTTQSNLLRQALWNDFHRFGDIRYNARNGQLFLSNEIESVSYRFEKERIIRERDTFDLQLERTQLYFENQARLNGIIDAIDLKVTKEFGGQRLFVFKKNTANNLMNQ